MLAVKPLAAAALTRTRASSARRLSSGVSATIRAPPKSMATSMLTGNAVAGGLGEGREGRRSGEHAGRGQRGG